MPSPPARPTSWAPHIARCREARCRRDAQRHRRVAARTRRIRDRLRQRRLHRLPGCSRSDWTRSRTISASVSSGGSSPRPWPWPSPAGPIGHRVRNGHLPDLETVAGVDAYAFTHNETSTGVMMDPVRAGGDGDLMLVDASAAGGLMFDADATDVYYFAPRRRLPPTAVCGSP